LTLINGWDLEIPDANGGLGDQIDLNDQMTHDDFDFGFPSACFDLAYAKYARFLGKGLEFCPKSLANFSIKVNLYKNAKYFFLEIV
jgi:hypothetical protein